MEKDLSLLRPFDLEAAKEGAAIDDTFGGRVVFVDGPDAGGKYAVRIDGHFAAVLGENLRMKPLCWVEGRPVYKGDVLWHRRRGQIVASHMIDDGEFLYEEGADSGDRVENLTWTPPKVKRQVKLLAYLVDADQLFWLREGVAPLWLSAVRVPSEDKTIEVEE